MDLTLSRNLYEEGLPDEVKLVENEDSSPTVKPPEVIGELQIFEQIVRSEVTRRLGDLKKLIASDVANLNAVRIRRGANESSLGNLANEIERLIGGILANQGAVVRVEQANSHVELSIEESQLEQLVALVKLLLKAEKVFEESKEKIAALQTDIEALDLDIPAIEREIAGFEHKPVKVRSLNAGYLKSLRAQLAQKSGTRDNNDRDRSRIERRKNKIHQLFKEIEDWGLDCMNESVLLETLEELLPEERKTNLLTFSVNLRVEEVIKQADEVQPLKPIRKSSESGRRRKNVAVKRPSQGNLIVLLTLAVGVVGWEVMKRRLADAAEGAADLLLDEARADFTGETSLSDTDEPSSDKLQDFCDHPPCVVVSDITWSMHTSSDNKALIGTQATTNPYQVKMSKADGEAVPLVPNKAVSIDLAEVAMSEQPITITSELSGKIEAMMSGNEDIVAGRNFNNHGKIDLLQGILTSFLRKHQGQNLSVFEAVMTEVRDETLARQLLSTWIRREMLSFFNLMDFAKNPSASIGKTFSNGYVRAYPRNSSKSTKGYEQAQFQYKFVNITPQPEGKTKFEMEISFVVKGETMTLPITVTQ